MRLFGRPDGQRVFRGLTVARQYTRMLLPEIIHEARELLQAGDLVPLQRLEKLPAPLLQTLEICGIELAGDLVGVISHPRGGQQEVVNFVRLAHRVLWIESRGR